MEQQMSEKSDFRSEVSEMSSVEFVQFALRDRVAPPSLGPVKARIRHAARRLSWTPSRTKDAWYADPRITIRADELRAIEEMTGLRYGREELRTVEDLISQADVLLMGADEDFHRPFAAALRAVARAFHRAGTSD
jgi:hypothetical protein